MEIQDDCLLEDHIRGKSLNLCLKVIEVSWITVSSLGYNQQASTLFRGNTAKKMQNQMKQPLLYKWIPQLMSATLNAKWLDWTVKNTPKSPSSWSKNDRVEIWWNKYPLNPTKSWTARGWGQIDIEEGGGQQNWRFRKIKGEAVRELLFYISTLESFSCTSKTMFLHIWKLDSIYFYLLI